MPPPSGVSIVVCARNELDNLTELLPLLNAQQYPIFEVLVMDDRSTDGTELFLENDIADLERVRFIRIDKEHEHVTPKKYALTIALKKASYPTVLLTDADCRPASDRLAGGMVAPLQTGPKSYFAGLFALRAPTRLSEPAYPVRNPIYGGAVFFAGPGGSPLHGCWPQSGLPNQPVFCQ